MSFRDTFLSICAADEAKKTGASAQRSAEAMRRHADEANGPDEPMFPAIPLEPVRISESLTELIAIRDRLNAEIERLTGLSKVLSGRKV